MSRLASISASPDLKEFAQGAAQESIMPVADFLAPTVAVATSVGRFKKYTEKNRFRIPQTLRTLGGRATELRFEAQDRPTTASPTRWTTRWTTSSSSRATAWRTCCAKARWPWPRSPPWPTRRR
jgi:hypothetical protein